MFNLIDQKQKIIDLGNTFALFRFLKRIFQNCSVRTSINNILGAASVEG